MSDPNIRVLDPPTNSCQLDANCGKIRYVSDPKGIMEKFLLKLLLPIFRRQTQEKYFRFAFHIFYLHSHREKRNLFRFNRSSK